MKENPRHKQFNEYISNYFKRHYSNFPDGKLRIGTPPKEPDIVITTEQGDIGIEITRFYREEGFSFSASQAQESLKEKIIIKSKRKYEDEGNPPLIVSIIWSAGVEIDKRSVDRISDNLKSLIVNNIPEIGESVVELEEYSSLSDEIAAIRINRIEEFTENDWHNSYGDFICDCTPERIQQIINKKNTKVSNYRGSFSSLWLLIVSVWELSSAAKITEETLNFRYTSNFDRVFLFDITNGRIEELNTK